MDCESLSSTTTPQSTLSQSLLEMSGRCQASIGGTSHMLQNLPLQSILRPSKLLIKTTTLIRVPAAAYARLLSVVHW